MAFLKEKEVPGSDKFYYSISFNQIDIVDKTDTMVGLIKQILHIVRIMPLLQFVKQFSQQL